MPVVPVRARWLSIAATCAALVLLGAAPASSTAASCSQTLATTADPTGATYMTDEYAEYALSGSDGWEWSQPYFDRTLYRYYFLSDPMACGLEDDDREVTYPPTDEPSAGIPVNGVTYTSKIFVPETGTPFVRHLHILTNETGATTTTELYVYFDSEGFADADVLTSSSGDDVANASDDWFTANDAAVPAESTALVWQGSGPRRESVDEVFESLRAFDTGPQEVRDGDARPVLRWAHVELAPGERAILMDLQAPRATGPEAQAAAVELASAPDYVFAGMSDDEVRDVRNFTAPDVDRDSVPNIADNCLYEANPDQSDIDADGSGDVCDSDIDGDGLSNDVESAISTNPANPDTDGDGKRDDVDQCPVTAGSQANGCGGDDAPPAVAFTAPADSASLNPSAPTTLSAVASDDRGVARVVFVDDGRVIGEDATAPYSIGYQPHGEDVGRNTLTAIAVDTAGQTAAAFRAVSVDRFDARSLSSTTLPGRDRRAPFRFITRGRLSLPAALSRADGCKGRVTVTFKAGRKTVSSRRVALRRDCAYRSQVTFRIPRRLNPKRLRVFARYGGSAVLKPEQATQRSVRVR